MLKPRTVLLLATLLAIGHSKLAQAVEVSYDENVKGVASNDSLQDIFPTMTDSGAKKNGGIPTPCLVDGGGSETVWLIGPGRPDNGMTIGFYPGPVRFIWDLKSDDVEVSKLSVAMYAGGGGNFGGQWSVSKDGKDYTTIPGTQIQKQFSAKNDLEAMKVLNRVNFQFAPGEVKGNRYLCLELSGYMEPYCEILEVDGWLKGKLPKKSTNIETAISGVAKAKVASASLPDQTKTPGARVLAPQFAGTQMRLPKQGNLALLDFKKLLAPPGPEWTTTQNRQAAQQIVTVQRRNDGLQRTLRLGIDKVGLVKLNVSIELPKESLTPVKYQTTTLAIDEAAVPFDGVVWGSGAGPIFVGRAQATGAEIGERIPYVIYPSQDKKLEVQLYMPAWYGYKGRLSTYRDSTLFQCDLLAAVQNIGPRDMRNAPAPANHWMGADKTFKPGEKLTYNLNMAVFDTSAAKPLGQSDIENTEDFVAMTGVDAGTGVQAALGKPRVLQRDKMRFIGFKLPPKGHKKLGHQIQIEPTQNVLTWLDRLKKTGTGFVNITSEYRDVCHGVSYNNNYDLAPPGLHDQFKKIKEAGIVSTVWFTTNAFLGIDVPWAKKDPMVDLHPEWFTGTSHWFGMHRTVNIFNKEAKLWSLNKIKSDFTKYPEIGGIYFDMFPWTSPPQVLQVGEENGLTGYENEEGWAREYYKAIKSFGKDKVFMGNGSSPAFDEHNFSDYGGSEHPLSMYLNDVLPGQISFGHPFVRWQSYGNLYFWYPLLGQVYYNFCDYDQAAGYVGTKWIGWEDGQMKKNFEKDVAPYWFITGKANRSFGLQLAPMVRQVEAKMPDGKTVVLVASMSNETADVTLAPRNLKPRKHRVTAYIDTAREHKEVRFDIDLKKDGISISQLPAFSMVRFEFNPS